MTLFPGGKIYWCSRYFNFKITPRKNSFKRRKTLTFEKSGKVHYALRTNKKIKPNGLALPFTVIKSFAERQGGKVVNNSGFWSYMAHIQILALLQY